MCVSFNFRIRDFCLLKCCNHKFIVVIQVEVERNKPRQHESYNGISKAKQKRREGVLVCLRDAAMIKKKVNRLVSMIPWGQGILRGMDCYDHKTYVPAGVPRQLLKQKWEKAKMRSINTEAIFFNCSHENSVLACELGSSWESGDPVILRWARAEDRGSEALLS